MLSTQSVSNIHPSDKPCNGAIKFLDHSDRDLIKARAEADFLNLFDAYGGRRRGRALFCLFHEDRTPSGSIFHGRFYCFGCGVCYDAIEFVQQLERTDFKSALASLANRYGVSLTAANLTQSEKREYARRREAAKNEARDFVTWKEDMIDALRESRNVYLEAYHRCLRFILTHSLNHPRANFIADACEAYETRYRDLDQRIERVNKATYAELLPFFRTRRSA